MNKKTLPPWPIESCSVLSAMIGSAMGIPKSVWGTTCSRFDESVVKPREKNTGWTGRLASPGCKVNPWETCKDMSTPLLFSAPQSWKKRGIVLLDGFFCLACFILFHCNTFTPKYPPRSTLGELEIFSCAENSFLDLGVEVQIGVTKQ